MCFRSGVYRNVRKHMISLSLRGKNVYKEAAKQWQDVTTRMSRPKVNYPERRIILIGKTGSGKSATGNNILKRNFFECGVSGSSVTRRSMWGEVKRFERTIQVIDTPGLFDTNMPHEHVKLQLLRALAMSAPGPHAFVFVIPVQRFTKEDQFTIRLFKAVYGDDIMKHSIVLFTRKDSLGDVSESIQTRILNIYHRRQRGKALTIEEFVRSAPSPLKNILSECADRFVAFNNRGYFWSRSRDVRTLVEMVDGVVENNGNSFYTNNYLQAIEKETKKRERKHRGRLGRKKRFTAAQRQEKLRKDLNNDSPAAKELLLFIGNVISPLASVIIRNIYKMYKNSD